MEGPLRAGIDPDGDSVRVNETAERFSTFGSGWDQLLLEPAENSGQDGLFPVPTRVF